jgi:23S rRNA pseudouridine1911/1915/1917 synthase
LDAVVSGVVVLARTSKAAERLNRQFRERDVDKTYWALVDGAPRPQHGELHDFLVKDERQHKVVVAKPTTPEAKEARLTYCTRGQVSGATWLEIKLTTGRKHQIRVQLAARGWPILGDAKYGSRSQFRGGIALHARSLEIEHPVSKQLVRCVAPLPPSWRPYAISDADDSPLSGDGWPN